MWGNLSPHSTLFATVERLGFFILTQLTNTSVRLMHTERDSEDEESEPAEPTAVGAETGVSAPLEHSESRRQLAHNNDNKNTYGTPSTDLTTSFLSSGATWIANATSEPLSCLGLRFLHVNEEEAFGLVKLGTSECGSAGMQYHHEFFSAELSRGALDLTNMIHDGPSCQELLGPSDCIALGFETDYARFSLRIEPQPSQRSGRGATQRGVRSGPLRPSPPPSPKLTRKALPTATDGRTYASVLKGDKPTNVPRELTDDWPHSNEQPPVTIHTKEITSAEGLERTIAEDHFPLPSSILSKPCRVSPEAVCDRNNLSKFNDSSLSPPRGKRRMSNNPLYGTAPFSTALTGALMTGALTAFDGSKTAVELSFIGTSSTEEFISATVPSSRDGNNNSFGSLKSTFRPERRKEAGYLESSCAFTLV